MKDNSQKNINEKPFKETPAPYVAGFISSIILTLAAYYMVIGTSFSAWTIAIVIAVLALVQFVIQLFFFMHLRVRTQPRLQFLVFLFMLLVVFILVDGSLWIMSSLNNRMVMTPDQVNQYMQDQAGL